MSSSFKNAWRVLGLSLALFPVSPVFADGPDSVLSDDRPVQVHGDSVEYFHEEERVVGTGNVSIDYEDVRLAADKITVHMGTKVAVAEGHVVLTQGETVYRGERGEY